MKILVVDGHTEAAEALAIMLELLGHEAKSATGKGEALRATLTLNPDVIFFDLDANDYRLAQVIRAGCIGKHPRLIGMATRASVHEAALQSGFEIVLEKPLIADVISEALLRGRATL
ncbi:hypothetical protein [Burkholderia sp. L27(2015)]|uniref:hypothetical protein n=1 Tax=Burkholderia sp. L27(2015) TaxID=1641858 RepID=UPI00131B240C|nr:hypothetical protein [Burkholderia sp. L27(2015)]